jgi:glucosamine--fructose-6-phosphate aminotransferase (isomerizing)
LSKNIDPLMIVISDCHNEEDQKFIKEYSDHQFYVPHNGYLSALLCVIPLQLSAFETTLALGRDPDRPRNLTKVV